MLFVVNSKLHSNGAIADCYHCGMDIRDVRHQNLQALRAIHGSWKEIERASQGVVTANYLSQLNNRTREVGTSLARKLESALGLPDGWMDAQQTGSAEQRQTGLDPRTQQLIADYTLVPRYDVTAGLGQGVWFRSEQVIDELAFKTGWLRGRGLQPDRVAVIACRGDSMAPTIRDGDVALIDLRSPAKLRDGVFAIRRQNNGDDSEIIVKRLQYLMSGKIRIISDNDDVASPEELQPEDMQGVEVIGGVVWAGGDVR